MIEKKGSILSVREDIKVFDCTIRDGGLVNNYHFTDEFVKALYDTCVYLFLYQMLKRFYFF